MLQKIYDFNVTKSVFSTYFSVVKNVIIYDINAVLSVIMIGFGVSLTTKVNYNIRRVMLFIYKYFMTVPGIIINLPSFRTKAQQHNVCEINVLN